MRLTFSTLRTLGCTALTINTRSMEAGTALLTFIRPLTAEPLPFATEDQIQLIQDDGIAVFYGWITTLTQTEETGILSVTVTISDAIARMQATPLLITPADIAEEEQPSPATVSAEKLFTLCKNAAEGYLEGNITGTIPPPFAYSTESIWNTLTALARWRPGTHSTANPETGIITLTDGKCTANLETLKNTLAKYGSITSVTTTRKAWAIPPCCSLRGIADIDIGQNPLSPGSFLYYANPEDEENDQYDMTANPANGQSPAATRPKMIIRGRRVPARTAAENWLPFWATLAPFQKLSKLQGKIAFGTPTLTTIPPETAYPTEQGPETSPGKYGTWGANEDAIPANYQDLADEENLYILIEGSFPASTRAKNNLSGLRFCRGTITQKIWLTSTPDEKTFSQEDVEKTFTGSGYYNGTLCRTALLQLDTIFINRRFVKYYTDTKQEQQDAETDYANQKNTAEKEKQQTIAAYRQSLQEYYNATRSDRAEHQIAIAECYTYPALAFEKPALTSATWNPFTGCATLTAGPAEPLGFSDLAQRLQITRQAAANTALSAAQALAASPSGTSDTEEQDNYENISPSVNATIAATAQGQEIEPFQIFFDEADNQWYMNGGLIATPAGLKQVDRVNVTDKMSKNTALAARVRFDDDDWQLYVTQCKIRT